jgi:hypothetical protein
MVRPQKAQVGQGAPYPGLEHRTRLRVALLIELDKNSSAKAFALFSLLTLKVA